MTDQVLVGKLAQVYADAVRAAQRAEANEAMAGDALIDLLKRENDGRVPTGAIVTASGEVVLVGGPDDEHPFVLLETRIA